MLTALFSLVVMSTSKPADFRSWGFEALAHIESELLVPGTHLYGEETQPGHDPGQVAYNWSVGVMMQALNSAARLDPAFKPRLNGFVDSTRSYWNASPPVSGYDVLPGAKTPDRYYDDNEWMVLALVDASKTLNRPDVLTWAREAYGYVSSGGDDKLGGGIYWRESDHGSKNTCSNAPAAADAIALYGATQEPSFLADGKRLYQWTRAHLRDPEDGLYWDSISLSGKIEKTKWTYNSGLMLRDAAELYRITKEEKYAQDAREILASSLKRWASPSGFLTDEGKFCHLLIENWLLAYRLIPGSKDPRPAIVKGLELVHSQTRDKAGHYGPRWDRIAPEDGYPTFALIDQAAAARAYLEAWTNLH
jgi:hypothetical protein